MTLARSLSMSTTVLVVLVTVGVLGGSPSAMATDELADAREALSRFLLEREPGATHRDALEAAIREKYGAARMTTEGVRAVSAIPSTERDALIALYNATNGASWTSRTNWRNAEDTDFNAVGTECTWRGVWCNDLETAVVAVYLTNNNLSGSLPSALGDLTLLEDIVMWGNALTGAIPSSLGTLANLVTLDLGGPGNALSGSIPPELGDCANLWILNLENNQLSGSIPSELGDLSALAYLYLGGNQLSGSIPADLGGLTALSDLHFGDNQLSGGIPSSLGALGNLRYLHLGSNQLEGSIPSELGDLASLRELYLYSNQLSGEIPADLADLTSLRNLSLDRNQLTGAIPDLGGLTSLRYLFLGYNPGLTAGDVPSWIDADLTSLLGLQLSYTNRTGDIPDLSVLSSLVALYLGDNPGLTAGDIPAWLLGSSMSQLQHLELSNTNRTGMIPDLSVMPLLETLYLGDNPGLSAGEIPSWLSGSLMSHLEELELSNTNRIGVPTDLSSLATLTELYLRDNPGLTAGPIPSWLETMTGLAYLELANTNRTDFIPSWFGNLINLEQLRLDFNPLTGSVPYELGSLTKLKRLRLNSKVLSGELPASLGNLTNLVDSSGLDLRWNALHSSDPTLTAFLNSKQVGGSWPGTQTVAPTAPGVAESTSSSLTLEWTPILYTADAGGYRVYVSETSGGPYTEDGMTANKSASGFTVDGLNPGETYYFVVETQTNPHTNNANTVISSPTAEFFGTTLDIFQLDVTLLGAGGGAVVSDPAGIDCGGTCSASFVENTVVTLTATPDVDSVFRWWTGACSGNGSCQVTMTGDTQVSATFEPKLIFSDGFNDGTTDAWSNVVD